MTGNFEREGKSIFFWGISKSPEMIIQPDGLLCSHFLDIDL